MSERSKMIRIIVSIVALIITSIILVYNFVNGNSIIINYGIKAYKSARMVSIITFIMAIVGTIINSIVISRKGEPTSEIKDMDKIKLLKALSEYYPRLGQNAAGRCSEMIRDLEGVENYSAEFQEIITDENRDVIGGAFPIIQSALDSMYKNLQVCYNYIKVLYKTDSQTVNQRLTVLYEENHSVFMATRGFVTDILDSISSGDDIDQNRVLYLIKSYKEAVLGDNSLEDKYLKEN